MQDFQNIPDAAAMTEQSPLFSELLSRLSLLQEDPIEGLAGYFVTEDPTYLPDDPDIKILIRMIGRDKLLRLTISRALQTSSLSEEV